MLDNRPVAAASRKWNRSSTTLLTATICGLWPQARVEWWLRRLRSVGDGRDAADDGPDSTRGGLAGSVTHRALPLRAAQSVEAYNSL